MSLLHLVVMLIVIGVGLHLVNRRLPMAPGIKRVLKAVVVIFVCLWLLQAAGVWSGPGAYRPG